MKRTTEIVIETDELIVVPRRAQVVRAWCATCEVEVEMFPPEIAAVVFHCSARDVYRLVESGAVHFTEDALGLLLVCSRSVGGAMGNER
jgi:hypothetical protein